MLLILELSFEPDLVLGLRILYNFTSRLLLFSLPPALDKNKNVTLEMRLL